MMPSVANNLANSIKDR